MLVLRGHNTIPYKLATLMTFEMLKWKYTFVTNVLIVTRDESPLVYRAPESASEHSHFGPLRNIVISGQARFGTAQLHYFKLLYRQCARKVGTSANSALIRYYLLHLKLSGSTRE